MSMDYEKKYKEALERARQIQNTPYTAHWDVMKELVEDLFPELKESEDEKIKGKIIATIHLYYGEPLEDEAKEMIAWLEKQGEQKPANWLQELEDKLANATPKQLAEWKEKYFKEEPDEWSEEDEEMYKKVKTAINSYYAPFSRDAEEMSEWFKNLKDRVQPQPKQEWNEEDEKMYTATIFALAGFMGNEDKLDWLKNKLKSLRHQKQDVMSVDEFRHIVGYLVQDIVANEHMTEADKQPTKFFVEKYYNQLRPQSHWKPSEEQMKALLESYKGGEKQAALASLYSDLKKLKGE